MDLYAAPLLSYTYPLSVCAILSKTLSGRSATVGDAELERDEFLRKHTYSWHCLLCYPEEVASSAQHEAASKMVAHWLYSAGGGMARDNKRILARSLLLGGGTLVREGVERALVCMSLQEGWCVGAGEVVDEMHEIQMDAGGLLRLAIAAMAERGGQGGVAMLVEGLCACQGLVSEHDCRLLSRVSSSLNVVT